LKQGESKLTLAIELGSLALVDNIVFECATRSRVPNLVLNLAQQILTSVLEHRLQLVVAAEGRLSFWCRSSRHGAATLSNETFAESPVRSR
jgi:hypothetical protein